MADVNIATRASIPASGITPCNAAASATALGVPTSARVAVAWRLSEERVTCEGREGEGVGRLPALPAPSPSTPFSLSYLIKVHQPQPPHPRAQQVGGRVRAHAAEADDDDQGVGQGRLAGPPQELDVASELFGDDGVGLQRRSGQRRSRGARGGRGLAHAAGAPVQVGAAAHAPPAEPVGDVDRGAAGRRARGGGGDRVGAHWGVWGGRDPGSDAASLS